MEDQNEIYEEGGYTIEELKADILREMKRFSKRSEEFAILSQRLTEITECEKNETMTKQTIAQKWSWIIPVGVQSATTAINTFLSYKMNRKTVNDVLAFEDRGNILTTKSAGYIKKPRE